MKHLLQTLLAFAFCSSLTAQNLQLGWAYANGSTGNDVARSIAVDAEGNTYTIGSFSGTVDFDKGPGVANLSVATGQTAPDAFVLKLDPQGNYVWAISIGGLTNTDQVATRVLIDTAGNVIVSGFFNGNILLPPSNSNYNTSLTLPGAFIIKLDTAGNALWSKAWAHSSNRVGFGGLTIDDDNNIIAIGNFTGTIDFSTSSTPNLKTSAGGRDFFVMKLDENGNLIDVKTAGNTLDCSGARIVYSANAYWITGYFKGTVDFDFSGNTNNLVSTNTTYNDIFMLRLNTDLTFIDAFAMGVGMDLTLTYDLLEVNDQYVYHVGLFNGQNMDFDPSPTQSTLFSSTYIRGFIQKFDSQRNLVWARAFTQTPPSTSTT